MYRDPCEWTHYIVHADRRKKLSVSPKALCIIQVRGLDFSNFGCREGNYSAYAGHPGATVLQSAV